MANTKTQKPNGVVLGSLRTNADKLVAMSVIGEIAQPKFGPMPYRIQAKTGQAIPLPGTGGIVYNKRIGDSCIDLVGDHIEPGVSMQHSDTNQAVTSANNGLNTLACIGNPVRVVTGDAKGEIGRVTGHHGGIEHVIVDFPPLVLETMAVGDKLQVRAFGMGLELLDVPDVKVFNLDPQLLAVLGWKIDRNHNLIVPVTHLVPGKIMGSGLGNNHVNRGDYDIQMFDEKTVKEYNLETLRFGDIVALTDVDNSYGRIWHSGSITIGVVIHSNSVVAGHGPGVSTLLSSLNGKIKPVLSEKANLAYYFAALEKRGKREKFVTLFVPAAVLFDLDGVLIDSVHNHFRSWSAILSEYHINVTLRDIALGEGERADVSLRRFFREKANRDVDETEVEKLLEKKRSYFRESNPPKILPEAKRVLQFFRAKKISIGLVSGSAMTNVRNSLTDEDLSLFDTTVTGDADLPGKPDPAPYREAMRRLHVEPKQCWVVENAPFGIRSAKAAGAFTIALTTTLMQDDLPGADVYCEHIEEVTGLYESASK